MTNVIDRSTPRGLARWARLASVLAVGLGLLAVLAMLLSGPGYRLGLLGLRAAFGLMGLGAKGGIAATVLALIALLLSLLSRSVRLSLLAVLGLLLGVLAFGPPALFARKAGEVPPIHDISTDTATPPPFQALLAQRAGSPNAAVYGGPEVAAQQRAAYPDIQPLQWEASPTKVFNAALATAQAMGWAIAAQQPSEGRIEATATTFWFGFKDDVVIRVRPDAGGTRLDIRSESRVGSSDVGANAERIRSFRKKLQEQLAHA
jgi:uncharacterized protein (DUF1499 family)